MDETTTVDYDTHPATVEQLLELMSKALYVLGKNEPREPARRACEEVYRCWHSVNSQHVAEQQRQAAVRAETEGGER